MRYWASGVGIATAEYAGVRHGMTVSSFTSIALEPPIVLVSMHKSTRTHDLVLGSKAFGVTLLSEGQQELSARFAGALDDEEDRFDGVEAFTLETGSPLIAGGLSVFDCRLKDSYDAGTTTIMIGEVVAARVNQNVESLQPLLYQNRAYHKIAQ